MLHASGAQEYRRRLIYIYIWRHSAKLKLWTMAECDQQHSSAFDVFVCACVLCARELARTVSDAYCNNGRNFLCNVVMNIHVSLRQTVSTAEASRIRARVFQELGWDHLVEVDKKWAVLGHPPSFALF